MQDREKVIKDLEFCVNGRYKVELSLATKILALLKEQEGTINELQNAYGYLQKQFFEAQDKLLKEQDAVEPKKIKGYNPPMYTLYEYECEECKSPMMNKQPFCMGCGKPVKWE